MVWKVLITIFFLILLAAISFIAGIAVVCLPNFINNRPRKRYQFSGPDSRSYKESVRAREISNMDGSVVDHECASTTFKT